MYVCTFSAEDWSPAVTVPSSVSMMQVGLKWKMPNCSSVKKGTHVSQAQHCAMACELKLLSLHIYACYSLSCLVKGAYLFKSIFLWSPPTTLQRWAYSTYYDVVTCSNPRHCMRLCTVYHRA